MDHRGKPKVRPTIIGRALYVLFAIGLDGRTPRQVMESAEQVVSDKKASMFSSLIMNYDGNIGSNLLLDIKIRICHIL